ncbi:HSP70/90 co-chaperone [Coemansia spiralis]|uniref:HSP70/90 co-chaperone n=1 Tax=Coemansia spiralis TaxID=417178 RepID=A0A9W8L5Y7_9FUNG|nr:HSP70/90 co-chaperone [Coemansia spiralis]
MSAEEGPAALTNAPVIGPAPSTVTQEERTQKLLEDLEKIPLFMTHLPDTDEPNLAVEALKSLASDEPPLEVATNLKAEGNDSFKRGKFTEAAQYYTKALDYDHDDKSLKVALLINRAAANLELQNYGMVLHDCADALRIRPNTVKALFRSAKACVALEKFEEAKECCKWGLNIEPQNKELAAMQTQVEEAVARHERRAREREERGRQKELAREQLKQAIEIRSELVFDTSSDKKKRSEDTPVSYPWENDSERQVELDRDSGHLLWPVFFLYPESKESDFVEKFDESLTLRDMLTEVLAEPPRWDSRQQPKYTLDNIDTYFLSRPVGGFDEDERLVKVSMDARLGVILNNEKYVIRDGIPSFIVLPRDDSFTSQFIERYRKLRQTQEAASKITTS